MSFFSQTVSVPHGTTVELVSPQTTNTQVWFSTANTGVLIGDSGVNAAGFPLPNYMMSFPLIAGDALYGYYNNATGSASIQILVTSNG